MGEEAMEKDINSVTPKVIKPKGRVEGNSTGKGVSQGSQSPSTRGEKPLPHYLTASSHSCHDFCKYGKQHVFEVKERRPRFSGKKAIKNEEQHQVKSFSAGERRKKPVIKLRTKSQRRLDYSDKSKVFKKNLSQRRLDFSDKPKVVKKNLQSLANGSRSPDEPASVTLETPLPYEETSASDKRAFLQAALDNVTIETPLPSQENLPSDDQAGLQDTFDNGVSTANVPVETPLPSQVKLASDDPAGLQDLLNNDTNMKNGQTSVKGMNLYDKKKKQVSKPKTTPLPKYSNKKTDLVQQKVSVQKDEATNNTDACGKPDDIKKRTTLPATETLGSAKPKVIRQKNLSSDNKNSAPAKPQTIKEKALSAPKEANASAKPASPLKKRTSLQKPTSTLNPTVDLIGQKDLENKKVNSSSPDTRKVDASAKITISLRRKVSIGRSSSLLNPTMGLLVQANAENNLIEGVSENKTVEKDEGKALPPLPPKIPTEGAQSMKPKKSFAKLASTVKSLAKISKALRSVDKTKASESKVSKSEDKRKLRKTTSVRRDDKSSNAYKLNFRRGKMVDVQPEDSGPKILRFRKPKEVSKNTSATGLLWRRSFSRKRGPGDGIIKDPNTGAQVIVLRHQDVQVKKDAQCLFNNVIEETAEQLVKSRKSKVKALVGAFETVISLQDSKPATS